MDGVTKKSDDDGMVKFSNVATGNHIYKISKEGYLKIRGSTNVDKDTKVSVKLAKIKNKNHNEERH